MPDKNGNLTIEEQIAAGAAGTAALGVPLTYAYTNPQAKQLVSSTFSNMGSGGPAWGGRFGAMSPWKRGGIGAMAGGIAGGLAGPPIAEATGSSRWGGAAAGGLTGAGIGTAIAPGIGTAIGGGIGALGGALLPSLFGVGDGGEKKAEAATGEALAQQLIKGGLPPEIAMQGAGTFNAMKAFGFSDDEARQGAWTQVQTAMQQSQTASQQPTPADLLSSQMLAARFMQPFVSDVMSNAGGQNSGLMKSIANAYALQAQAVPFIQAQENHLGIQRQLAQNGSGGGAASLADALLAAGA